MIARAGGLVVLVAGAIPGERLTARIERVGKGVAYASAVSFWPMDHGVAESEDDMNGLLLGAAAAIEEPIALLVPLRSGLFRWCLEEGLRLVKPMNLMAFGDYREPQGAWFPSVLY